MYEEAVGKPTPVLEIHHDNKQYGTGKKHFKKEKKNQGKVKPVEKSLNENTSYQEFYT